MEEERDVWEDMMGLPGCTGDTAMERGVGEEAAGVGVDGVLLPPFCRHTTVQVYIQCHVLVHVYIHVYTNSTRTHTCRVNSLI